jgi:uncharacterized protein YdeI (YjbR/CyaY-like superfamily)
MSCADRTVKSVDAYFEKVPAYARPICHALRKLIHESGPELRECIKWNSPCYAGRGLVFGIGAFQKHVRLFFFKGAQVPDPDALFVRGQNNAAARSVKFSSLEEIPTKKLQSLVRAAVKLDADAQSKPARRTRRAELPMPKELAAALKTASKAQHYFDTLPPSCRREYIEWISTAKKEETRTRRIAEALEVLSAGRGRNEPYRAKA